MPLTFTYMVANYNYARFLAENLAGMGMQTRQADRVLVTDDVSTRDTPEQIRAAASAMPQAEIVFNETNIGSLPHARKDVAMVRTDAYLLMSADDYLVDPNFIADALDLLEAHPNLVAVTGHHEPVDETGKPLGPLKIDTSAPWTLLPARDLRRRLALENVVPAICTVVRTSAHQRVPAYPVDNDLCGDWIHWYMLTFSGDVARLNRVVCAYRIHQQNLHLAHQRSGKQMQLMAEGYRTLLALPDLDDETRDILAAGRARVLIRSAPIRQLPGVLAREAKQSMAWLALAETLCERVASSLNQTALRYRDRAIARAPLP